MEVSQVLHMKGGVGEASYAKNSLLQQKALTLAKPIREEAITNMYHNMLLPTTTRSLVIADLGCSSGPNTFIVVSEVIKTVEKLRQELNHQSLEYQVFLNDLPSNDFNSIFRSLDNFKEKLNPEMVSVFGPCFLAGVPGSFYGRLFPTKSLHFVHSSYSLQWLSQVLLNIYNINSDFFRFSLFLAINGPPSYPKRKT
ncbi:hypothetical protein K1719_024216 [Acacia pycnantha]|nr:hypothetical protein K1719_024216 [Acacia pycnantha]